MLKQEGIFEDLCDPPTSTADLLATTTTANPLEVHHRLYHYNYSTLPHERFYLPINVSFDQNPAVFLQVGNRLSLINARACEL